MRNVAIKVLIVLLVVSCDGMFINTYPSYLYDLDCINIDKIDSLSKKLNYDTSIDLLLKNRVLFLLKDEKVKKVLCLENPCEIIGLNEHLDIQCAYNEYLSLGGYIFNKNIPKSEILRIGKRVDSLLKKENCESNVYNNFDYEEVECFGDVSKVVTKEWIECLYLKHSTNQIEDTLFKEILDYSKFLANDNHAFYFKNPNELIFLSKDYKKVIYYYSKTLKSFKEDNIDVVYNYNDEYPNRVIIFPNSYDLKISFQEKERIISRISNVCR